MSTYPLCVIETSHEGMCSLILTTKQVNSYPTVRGFTAIGTGGDDFVQSMVVAVESVLQQTIPEVSNLFILMSS